jgi:hypothetical protein
MNVNITNVNRSTLYANMLSISFQFIDTAPLVKWIIKEEGLYVNSSTVILMFKCSDAKKYCNGFNDGPECKLRPANEDFLFKENYWQLGI